MSGASLHGELDGLLTKLLAEGLASPEQDRLGRILEGDADARLVYRKYMIVDALLRWDNAPPIAAKGDGNDECGMVKDELPAAQEAASSEFIGSHCASCLPPIVIRTYSSPFSSLHSFVGGALFSYLMAAVIVGFGLTVAAAWKLANVPKVVDSESPFATAPWREVPSSLTFVGQVTRMVDCRWADPKTEPVLGAHVPLGRKYALSAGLMEVSYDSGAKVLLQGPVTYEVESADGGYLSVGKLTATLEKSEVRGQQSEVRGQKFAIRTPTAVVTDLGTEFGVEVQPSGLTKTHVFRGTVTLQAISAKKTPIGAAEVLREHESGQVQEARAGTEPAVRRIAVDPTAFVPSEQLGKLANPASQAPFVRWQAYRDTLRRDPSLLAYYDFQQKPGAPKVLANAAANAHGLYDGMIENARWTDGRTPGKHALLFNGVQDYVSVNLPQTVDDLTLAAWIYAEWGSGGLLMSDGWKKNGLIHWQLADYGQVGFDVYDSSKREWAFTSPPVFEGDRLRRWTHVVVVFDHDAPSVRFYVDGRSLGQTGAATVVPIRIGSARIGQWNYGSYVGGEGRRNFSGRIDELAVFGRLLTLEEIRRMFQAGCVPSLGATP